MKRKNRSNKKAEEKSINPEKLRKQKAEAAKLGLWKEVARINKCIEFNTTAKKTGILRSTMYRKRRGIRRPEQSPGAFGPKPCKLSGF